MNKKGKMIVVETKGNAFLREFEIPKLDDDQILVKSDYSVISAGTERANLVGLPNTSGTFPYYPGYSSSGRVEAVGKNIKKLVPGDRVVVAGGGHRTHTVRSEYDLLKIEDDPIDMLDAAFTYIVSFSLLGVRKLRLELGESVMIAGQGILGVFALQIALLSGGFPVFVSDPDPKRRELALKLGATGAFSPSDPDFIDQVMKATNGEGIKKIVEVSGNAIALQQALKYVAWQGSISLLGCTRISDAAIDFYRYVHIRGIHLIGSHMLTRPRQESRPGEWTAVDDYRTFLKLLAAGKMQTRPLISEIVSPEQTPGVYSRLAEMKQPPLGFVIDWRSDK